jgi:multimeric flavodoxin WrbA
VSVGSDTAPRVLCLAGSPRRGGNSDRLLDAFEAGARAAGGDVTRVVVAEANVAPCRGCNACSSTGTCVVHDGMDEVYRLLDAADVLVVSSPVYFATVPAVLKALYDRCQPYWARRYVLGEPRAAHRRPGALLLVGGGGDPFGSGCAVTPTRSVFNVLDVDLTEQLEVLDVDSPTDISRRSEALLRAEDIGSALVAAARLS